MRWLALWKNGSVYRPLRPTYHIALTPSRMLREYRNTLVLARSPTLLSMSHTATLVEVSCPLTSQLVIARKPKLLISRVLPAVPKTPCAVLEGRSGNQVLTYWATMNECC